LNVIILWKQPNGVYTQETPGKPIASTISEAALERLAGDYNVFVLELSKDEAKVKVKKIK